MIYKNKGIIYSQYILDYLNNYLEVKKDISIETFYNCREQGYLLNVYLVNGTPLRIWLYAQRNSDKPTITYKRGYTDADNMFDEESWLNTTKTFNTVEDAADETLKLIEKYVEEDK